MTIRTLVLSACCLASAACTTLEPQIAAKPTQGYDLVDPAKVEVAQYERDYAQCAALANKDSTGVEHTATKALGTVADRATFGIIGQRSSKDADRRAVLKRCLTGRGYNVLR